MIKKDSFILPNGLQVLVMTDDLANKASCAVDFKTGFINDPDDALGLSHLLEHIISSQFVGGKIGQFNASTGYEHSNFRFEIDSRSFLEALGSFAGGLISPVINKERTEAEKRAINSEFEKSRYDVSTLRSHVMNTVCSNMRFAHGNMSTLKDVAVEQVLGFFNEHYFLSKAKMAIVSSFSLEQVKEVVEKEFNDPRVPSKHFHKLPSSLLSKKDGPQFIMAELDDSLLLCFETGRIYDKYRTKPQWVLNYLINTKRAGSLSKRLKDLGLVTDVWSSVQPFSFSSLFFVEFKPTTLGINGPEKIIAEFFSYLNFIKKEGYPKYIFEEQKDISDIGSRFREQNEGMSAVKDIAKLMHYYPAGTALEFNDLLFDHSVDDFNELLHCIVPKRMKALLCCNNIGDSEHDRYYGISYKEGTFKETIAFKGADYHYPKKNNFIMHDVVINNDDAMNTFPYELMHDEKGEIWFLQDNVLKLPMLYCNFLILTPQVNKDPISKLYSILYVRVVSMMLEEVLDEAGEAGLSFGIERDDRGISLFFSGYSQKMPLLFEKVFSALRPSLIDQLMLETIKNGLKDDYRSLQCGSSYSIAQYFKYQLIHKNNIPYTDYIDAIDQVDVNVMLGFCDSIYDRIRVEGYVFGDISPDKVKGIVKDIFEKLEAQPLAVSLMPKDIVIDYKKGNSFAYVVETPSLDNCWSAFYEFGTRTIRLSGAIQLGHMFLSPFFFEKMRIQKQLGYLAETRTEFFEKVLGLSFVVLSDDRTSDDIAKEAENVLNEFCSYLRDLSEDHFQKTKNILIERVNKNNRTLEDWMNDVVLTAVFKGDVLYAKKISAEIASLTIKEVADTFEEAFSATKRSRVSVYVGKANTPSKSETMITDIRAFKASIGGF